MKILKPSMRYIIMYYIYLQKNNKGSLLHRITELDELRHYKSNSEQHYKDRRKISFLCYKLINSGKEDSC